MSKSEVDLLMFKIYFRAMEENNAENSSDASLAILLGISKQRVKLLREKMELFLKSVLQEKEQEVCKLLAKKTKSKNIRDESGKKGLEKFRCKNRV